MTVRCRVRRLPKWSSTEIYGRGFSWVAIKTKGIGGTSGEAGKFIYTFSTWGIPTKGAENIPYQLDFELFDKINVDVDISRN
ncbi:hypothetical protein Cni_G16445 [Canna indica]|uniref:Uncharacterized protein n=1 Tax=Canna indica TaxID=4628 RepID=A0AAQ3KF52_9LILI|nr:hypothetical protein Cni_G16445 [Canna indica]